MTAPAQAPASLLDALLAAETAVWDALVAGDAEADARLLHDAFVGVYPDGPHGKAAHVGQMRDGPTIADYALSAAQARPVGAEHGLLIYRADILRIGAQVWEAMHVSSLWQRQDGGWINLFSQDTPADGAVRAP